MLQGLNASGAQRPVKAPDSSNIEVTERGNGYGELYTQLTDPDGLGANLLESSYVSAVLSGDTPGSTYATGAVQTSFSDTSALVILKNNAPTNSNINIRPDTLKLIVLAAGTGLTAMHLAAVLDDASRWGSAPGGTAFAFAPSSNSGANQSSISQAVFGGLGPQAATGNKRIVGRCVLKAAAPVVNDEFLIRFSNAAQPSGSLASGSAATIIRHMEPLLISPGKALILHAWWPGCTVGPNLEPMLTVIER